MKGSSLRRAVITASLLLALCLVWVAIPLAAAQDAPAVVFTVNSANDVDDGACNAAHCADADELLKPYCSAEGLDFPIEAVLARATQPAGSADDTPVASR